VEFGLLGPLVVRAGGSGVDVSAGKQRVLLAALLLRANQVVPAAELAGFLWEGSPPGTARVTLQNYVKRVRQALGPAGYERIVTRPPGYLIQVEPGELDVARFEQLAAAGRAAARAGSWKRASALLGEALGLWRGEPLADVPSAALRAAEVPRLAELRLEAAEGRAEAGLFLGRHAEMVGELAALVAAEPLRERLAELLMLALYRSGQQAAALAVYRRARRRLVERVGIEPGPGLREMNQKILLSDPGLRLPAPPGTAAAARGNGHRGAAANVAGPTGHAAAAGGNGRVAASAVRPSLLPSAVPDFTGRAAELAALSAVPGRDGRPVVITAIGGTAGVGKTALAVHWARQAAPGFPDGQLYVNLRGFGPGDPLPPSEALRAFLDALQVPPAQIPASLDGRYALYRSLLDGKKILILLDNARDPAQVRPLLPGSPDAQVLITSRAELASLVVTDGAAQISLDVLTEEEARQMLAARLGPGRVADEPAAADELIGLCARLPLALAITAARAAAHPGFTLAALAAELRDARGRLDVLSTGEEATDVRAVFSWSYHSLPAPAARMFRLLGLVPGPDITAEAAASLAGLPVSEARRLLRELARGQLLTEPASGRFSFHDLLRAYAAEQAEASETAAVRAEAVGRALDYYLHTAHAAAFLLYPGKIPVTLGPPRRGAVPEQLDDDRQAWLWLDAEYKVLLAVIRFAASAGFDAHAWQVSWCLAEFFDRRGRWHDWAAAQRVALAAARRAGDLAGQACAHRDLGYACARLSSHADASAHLVQALTLFRQLGDRVGEARAHHARAQLAEHEGCHRTALGHALRALEAYRAAGHQAGLARALNAVGWYRSHLGEHQLALEQCQQALELHRQVGDRPGEADTWDSLGYAHHGLGDYEEAVRCYSRALALYSELSDHRSQATVLACLGEAHYAADNLPAASQAWQRALDLLDQQYDADADRLRARFAELSHPGPGSRPLLPAAGSPEDLPISSNL
jgi:DNA-binding SARP family transcriptional activator/tetratricopeptide (TPR) repeat protein